jgi:hypothetical protein
MKTELQRFFYISIISLLVLLYSGISPAAPYEKISRNEFEGKKGQITIKLSNNEITVADSLSLTVEVLVPAGFRADLPSFKDFGFSTDFNERSHRFRSTDIFEPEIINQDDGSQLHIHKYTLEPWLSGDYSIMPLMVSFFEENQKEKEKLKDTKAWNIPTFNIMTDGIRVRVTGLSDGRQELSDLFAQSDYNLEKLTRKERRKEDKSGQELRREEEDKQEASMAFKDKGFPWWLIWVFLVLVFLAPLIWYLGQNKIKGFFAQPPQPAHEIAYQALRRLEGQNLPGKGMIKEYYYELSYILREYIGNRFKIYAVNQSSEEFFKQLLLTSNPFDLETEHILHQFLDHSDTVKYSLHRPDIPMTRNSFEIVESFVDKTRLGPEDIEKKG